MLLHQTVTSAFVKRASGSELSKWRDQGVDPEYLTTPSHQHVGHVATKSWRSEFEEMANLQPMTAADLQAMHERRSAAAFVGEYALAMPEDFGQ